MSATISIRVPSDQKLDLQNTATSQGLTLNDYCKNKLTQSHLDSHSFAVVLESKLKRVSSEISNHLSQLEERLDSLESRQNLILDESRSTPQNHHQFSVDTQKEVTQIRYLSSRLNFFMEANLKRSSTPEKAQSFINETQRLFEEYLREIRSETQPS